MDETDRHQWLYLWRQAILTDPAARVALHAYATTTTDAPLARLMLGWLEETKGQASNLMATYLNQRVEGIPPTRPGEVVEPA